MRIGIERVSKAARRMESASIDNGGNFVRR